MTVRSSLFTVTFFLLALSAAPARPFNTVTQKTTIINVKQFGAAGDGKHDDTEAIYKASRMVSSLGGTLYFPAGLYLSRTIALSPKPGVTVTIRGVKGKTTIRRIGGQVALFFSESLKNHLIFRDLALDGSSGNEASKWKRQSDGTLLIDDEVNGIYVYNASSLEVYGCVIKNFHGKGIAAFSTARFIAGDNVITEVNNSGINGHRVSYMEVINNKIIHTGFVPGSFYLRGKVIYRKENNPVTRFGDGIEAECDRLLATGNTVVNPGRCGIVHDLGKDLGYLVRRADIRSNNIQFDNDNILNDNPPAGIWCEQSRDVDVSKNSITIRRSASKVVSGIRFFNTDGRITCRSNVINATNSNQQVPAAIAVLEPAAAVTEIFGNKLTGRFKSGIALSYERNSANLKYLRVMSNLVNLNGNTTGLLITVKSRKRFPDRIDLENNQFSGAGLRPFWFAVYGGGPSQKDIVDFQSINNTWNRIAITKAQSKAWGVITEFHE